MHDASEAYLVDLPRPIKHHPDMALFRTLETKIQCVICERFDLDFQEPASVKIADARMLATEARDLFPPDIDWDLEGRVPYADILSVPEVLDPRIIKAQFLARFKELVPKYKTTYTL